MGSLTISSKAEFFKESLAMRLGNRLEQWTWPEFVVRYNSQQLPNLVGVRSGMRVGNKKTALYSPENAMALAVAHSPESQLWLFDEALPPPLIVLQGEVMSDERHLYLRWTCHKSHMRTAFKHDYETNGRTFHHDYGFKAWSILKTHMDASSWDCLQGILHNYDHPIVEFSIANRAVGIFKWNTIFWEVRTHY